MRRIGDMQRMAAILVTEPVEEAILFEPAQQIIEIRLVPLHRIMLRRGRRDDAGHIGRGDAVLGEQGLDNVDGGLVHPDAAIGPARQEPHLRPHDERIGTKPARDRRAFVEVRHQPVERAAHAVLPAYLERDIDEPADEILRLDRLGFGPRGDPDLEQVVDAFEDRHAFRQKLIGPQRRDEPQHAVGLDEIGGGDQIRHSSLSL